MLVAMAIFLWHPSMAFAGTILGSAQSFAVLGASTVTNVGSSTISGNLGVYAGSAVTGFPPGAVTNGTIHITDGVAQQAQIDERFAYNALALLPSTFNETGIDLGGLTLSPGVYKFTSGAQLTGALTLDFGGNPNALFVFQIGSTLITGSGASVSVINGTATDGVFWQVGSSATLGSSTTFVGNILALANISMDSTAKIECGRAFAQTGGVTLITNTISSTCGIDFVSGPADFPSNSTGGSSGGSSPSLAGSLPSLVIVTPEPGTFLLLGISLLGVVVKYSRQYSARGK
jgi:type VI secretion system secreted protein VgrG